MDVLYLFLIIWPPYVANGSATLSSKIRSRHPIDLGRNFIDGRRIFGDGKTYEGLAVAVVSGTLLGYLPNLVYPKISLFDAFLLSIAAVVGDLIGAFVKRRLCMPRGYPAFPLDQLDFLLFSLFIYSLYNELPVEYILAAAAATPAIHRGTNYIAYRIGLKKEPW
ncbi:MAG: CDP-2,3-bis-(O-geranylgeranyl)-sn-glycerol synthase [Pyrobaculum sp.]